MAIGLLSVASPSWAIGPQAQDIIAIQESLFRDRCRDTRDFIERQIVEGYPGSAARLDAIEKRRREEKAAAREAFEKRFAAVSTYQPSPEEAQAIRAAGMKLAGRCPWGTEGIPRVLPPFADDAAALDEIVFYVPRTLMNLRQCEVVFPERRGVVEKAWTASVFSKLAIPELQAPVDEVRAWLKDDLGSPVHGSKVERRLKDPDVRALQEAICDESERDLARVEAALPASFVAKYMKNELRKK